VSTQSLHFSGTAAFGSIEASGGAGLRRQQSERWFEPSHIHMINSQENLYRHARDPEISNSKFIAGSQIQSKTHPATELSSSPPPPSACGNWEDPFVHYLGVDFLSHLDDDFQVSPGLKARS
jgi:hypothetical protein